MLHKRTELAPALGSAVFATGTLQAISAKTQRHFGKLPQQTLLVTDITVNGQTPIHHAWIKLGPVGSERINHMDAKTPLIGLPIRFHAHVSVYRTGEVRRFGLHAPHDIEVKVRGKWRCIKRKIERYSDDHSNPEIEELQLERKRQQQEPLLLQFKELSLKDKSSRQIIERFFIRGEVCTEKQMRHAEQKIKEALS